MKNLLLSTAIGDIAGMPYEFTIHQIMGSRIDVLKLKTSMMLFDKVSPNDVFVRVIEEFFSNKSNKRNAL